MHALARDRRILDLHARIRSDEDVPPDGDGVGRQHPPLAEAGEPDHDHVELPPAVLGPRVDDLPDLFPVAVLNPQSEQVPPSHTFHMPRIGPVAPAAPPGQDPNWPSTT